jgi:AraC-like DNA-binding protein
LMNLSTYFLSCWLFSSALMTLLVKTYLTVHRFIFHIVLWLLFTAVSGVILLMVPDGIFEWIGLLVMAVWFFFYGFTLARRLIITYKRAVRLFDDTHSDYIAAYIHWLSIFTYWAVIYGVSCGLLTFLPDKYVFLWILSSIPFYIYLFCSYLNYLLFYEQVEQILENEMDAESPLAGGESQENMSSYHAEIANNLTTWIAEDGFTSPGLTIEELSGKLNTNRTYLADYIKTTYHISFRDYITGLRLDFAKRMLVEHPEMTVNGISESAGFLSPSYFTKIFREKEGDSPARWRKIAQTENP